MHLAQKVFTCVKLGYQAPVDYQSLCRYHFDVEVAKVQLTTRGSLTGTCVFHTIECSLCNILYCLSRNCLSRTDVKIAARSGDAAQKLVSKP